MMYSRPLLVSNALVQLSMSRVFRRYSPLILEVVEIQTTYNVKVFGSQFLRRDNPLKPNIFLHYRKL